MTIKEKKNLWGKNSQAWVSGFCPHGDSPFSFTEDGFDWWRKALFIFVWAGALKEEQYPWGHSLVEAIIIKDISQRNERSLSFRTTEFICPSLLAISPFTANPGILSVTLLRDSLGPVYTSPTWMTSQNFSHFPPTGQFSFDSLRKSGNIGS